MKLNRIYHCILLLIIGSIIQSCIVINGSGLSNLSEAEKRKVKPCPNIDSIQNDGNLYKVTAKQLGISTLIIIKLTAISFM